MKRKTLAIVDDHPVLLRGMEALFRRRPGFEVVAIGSVADDAVRIVREQKPDLVLMDLNMPGDPFSAIWSMSSPEFQTNIVAFTASRDINYAVRAFLAGASAFVVKGCAGDDLVKALDVVAAGDTYITPNFHDKVVAALRDAVRDTPESTLHLSAEQQNFAMLLGQGLTNGAIAHKLGLGTEQIRQRITAVSQELGVRGRLVAALKIEDLSGLARQ